MLMSSDNQRDPAPRVLRPRYKPNYLHLRRCPRLRLPDRLGNMPVDGQVKALTGLGASLTSFRRPKSWASP